MCRACSAIVGAGESRCAVCGAATGSGTAAGQQPVADRETMRFARAVLERPYKFTIILLVLNFFVFLLMWQSSRMTFSVLGAFPGEVLVAYGARLNSKIVNEHQWWRFVTPMFLHINFLHLMVNMYSLWIVGPYVEKIYGSARFIVFWVATGIAASVASFLTVVDPSTPLSPLARFLFHPDVPAAGASGALFGLVGVLFVFGIKFRHELPEGFKRAFGTGLLPMILINLFIGYIARGLFGNAAHLGGLFTGAALALVVGYRRPGESSGVAITWQVLRIAAIVVVLLSFAKVAQHFPTAGVAHSTPTATPINDFVNYAKALNKAQETFLEAMKGDPRAIDPAVQGLESAPHLDQRADDLKERLKVLLLDAKKLRTEMPAEHRESVQKKENELTTGFLAWSNEYEQWLKTEGKTHAGLTDPPAR